MKEEKELQLVTFEQAKKLKELGFDWECYTYYDSCFGAEFDKIHPDKFNNWNDNDFIVSAPPVALALKWFRDVKKIGYAIKYNKYSDGEYVVIKWTAYYDGDKHIICAIYELVEINLLDELINFCGREGK